MRRKGIMGIAALVLMLMTVIAPVQAHVPAGAGEAPEGEIGEIVMFDAGGRLLRISIDDAAEIHGDLCVCTACAFRVTQAAISQLYNLEEELPTQGEIKVTYHHPGKGHKDVLEYLLTPECVTYEKVGNPKHLTLEHYTYQFTRTDTGDTFETQVKEGIIPEDFPDLRYKVEGFKNGWHEDKPTEAEKAAFAERWTEARDNFLTMELGELFEGMESEEEEEGGFPMAGVVFTGVVIVALIAGLGYSQVAKKG